MKINVKYRNVIYACLMAFCMSFFISFILVSINRGYDHLFLSAWLKTWSQAFICAFFGAYFFPGVIQQIMRRINFVEKPLMIEKDLLVREEDNG
ncbi:DUF2798 domain-containing protein [[Brevibacterium] frigoritolerans]|nr:DUF2798 domain-containing protein [Peribacillus frigoritolerans]